MPRSESSRSRRPLAVDWRSLMTSARLARRRAYAPYSRFPVGAAVLGASGRVYLGCNVENASYGLTVCAERHAVAQAVLNGERRLMAVAITAGPDLCPPCGACRQVLAELGDADMPVLLFAGRARDVHRLGALLPQAFDRAALGGRAAPAPSRRRGRSATSRGG